VDWEALVVILDAADGHLELARRGCLLGHQPGSNPRYITAHYKLAVYEELQHARERINNALQALQE